VDEKNKSEGFFRKWFGSSPEPEAGPVVHVPPDIQRAYDKLLQQTNAIHSRLNIMERRQKIGRDAMATLLKDLTREDKEDD
jgi:hypothetical protein